MRFRLVFSPILITVFMLIAPPAVADLSDWMVFGDHEQECVSGDPKRQIQSCSAIIEDGRTSETRRVFAYNNRCAAHIEQGRHDKAIADCSQAIQLDPDDATAYHNRGLAHRKKGNTDQAIADHTEAIRLDPSYTGAYTGRGLAHEKRGKTAQARADYNAALAIPKKYGSGALAHGIARERLAALGHKLINGIPKRRRVRFAFLPNTGGSLSCLSAAMN